MKLPWKRPNPVGPQNPIVVGTAEASAPEPVDETPAPALGVLSDDSSYVSPTIVAEHAAHIRGWRRIGAVDRRGW